MGKHHSKLNQTEREQIARWKKGGISNKECAKRLGRDTSTIGRELKRNSFRDKQKQDIYEPLQAQSQADDRKEKAWKVKQPLKNKDIYAYVMKRLRDGWSPEQISGRLKHNYPNDTYWHVSYETIYQYIYHKDNKDKKLWEYLRRKQKRRRKKHGRASKRSRIPDRVSIHKRPEKIDKRKEIGHWEGDSIIGKNHANGLHTEYERYSSLIRFEKLISVNADETVKAQMKIFAPLPKELRSSTTLDNGSEMTKHTELRSIGMKTYFADPYSAWQRGGNENANLWIRYYFPKKTDFNTISDEELKDVEWELNNRPRKRLHFKKPIEVFKKHLKGCNRY